MEKLHQFENKMEKLTDKIEQLLLSKEVHIVKLASRSAFFKYEIFFASKHLMTLSFDIGEIGFVEAIKQNIEGNHVDCKSKWV